MLKPALLAAAALIALPCMLSPAKDAAAQPTRLPPPAPLPALVAKVDIPYTTFTLPNGLRVVVHVDHKAPVVALHTWYDVGAGDEPAGETGFAHLFEHLMFAGSEHVANYDLPLENAGGQNNGSTTSDRTNYYVDAPKGALDLALFLEADRMEHLLPAISQEKLDNQRGVVQNEKRQGDNQPYALTRYAIPEALFPAGHPYHHSTIGSMADLDVATLSTVKAWFDGHYGPSNAVLGIAGDVDPVAVRASVTRFFGAIPRGPTAAARVPNVPRLTGVRHATMHDRVPTTQLYFAYTAPAATDPTARSLETAVTILASGGASRLYNDLVRDKKLALSVNGGLEDGRLASTVLVVVNVKPGIDPAVVEREVERELARFLKDGPSADEVTRVATREVAGAIRGLETANAAASTLAQNWLFAGDPGFYKTDLARFAAATPASVRAAAREWMGGGSFRLTVAPGERGASELAYVGASGVAPKPKADALPAGDPRLLPPVPMAAALVFPAIERARLSNGIPVVFARRAELPVVEILASFDAGSAADRRDKLGTQAMTINLLDEGTTHRTGPQIVEEAERLGLSLRVAAGQDSTRAFLSALTPNLRASLDLFGDVLRNPAFAPEQLERVRAQQLSEIAQEQSTPGGIASRALAPIVYGPDHPYGAPPSGNGDAASVARVTRDDLIAFHRAWFRPDDLTLFVVGDTTLAALMPELERALGDWRADPAVAKGVKRFPPVAAMAGGRILLIDRPNSPQSYIAAGQPLAVRGTEDPLALSIANEQLGGGFTSRLNTDLRETRGWAYGVNSATRPVKEQMSFRLAAPVQADKTGASIAAILDDIRAYDGPKPITPVELTRVANLNVLSLPGAFETSGALVGALESSAILGRPDDYYTLLPARTRALTPIEVARAARANLDPARLRWVVVGDAKVVAPQLGALGLPVEVREAR